MSTARRVTQPRRVPQQRRSLETYNRILEAAADQVRSAGVSSVTISVICERSGLSKGSVYPYFDDALSIVHTLMDREADAAQVFVIERLLGAEFGSAAEAAVSIYENAVDYYRSSALARALWIESGLGLGYRARTELARTDARPFREIGDFLAAAGLLSGPLDDALRDELELSYTIGEAVLQLAFNRHPDGDQVTIDAGKQVLADRAANY